MATATLASVKVAKGVLKSTWGAMTATADVGTALSAPNYPDKTISVRGTFNGATLQIVGSNNSATGPWTQLNDTRGEGNALTFTTTDVRTILENPLFIRPSFSTATAAATRAVVVEITSQSGQR